MTADDKYSLCNIWNLQLVIQMQLSKNLKPFFRIFPPFLKFASNLKHFEKKDESHPSSMYFQSYRLWNTCLDKCLNTPVSKYPSTVNMSKRPKHLWKLHDRGFIIFCDYSEGSWLGKCLCYWCFNRWESFFKPLLLMTSILCAIVRVCRNKFKWNYLKTFYIILLNFLNWRQILNI